MDSTLERRGALLLRDRTLERRIEHEHHGHLLDLFHTDEPPAHPCSEMAGEHRVRLLRKLEESRRSRVIALVHRQETMSLLGFPIFRYINIEDHPFAMVSQNALANCSIELSTILDLTGWCSGDRLKHRASCITFCRSVYALASCQRFKVYRCPPCSPLSNFTSRFLRCRVGFSD